MKFLLGRTHWLWEAIEAYEKSSEQSLLTNIYYKTVDRIHIDT